MRFGNLPIASAIDRPTGLRPGEGPEGGGLDERGLRMPSSSAWRRSLLPCRRPPSFSCPAPFSSGWPATPERRLKWADQALDPTARTGRRPVLALERPAWTGGRSVWFWQRPAWAGGLGGWGAGSRGGPFSCDMLGESVDRNEDFPGFRPLRQQRDGECPANPLIGLGLRRDSDERSDVVGGEQPLVPEPRFQIIENSLIVHGSRLLPSCYCPVGFLSRGGARVKIMRSSRCYFCPRPQTGGLLSKGGIKRKVGRSRSIGGLDEAQAI